MRCLASTLARRSLNHPKVGASWEGMAIQQLIRRLGADATECFSWKAHTGAELDLLVVRGTRRRGFEIKLTDAPSVTRSMRSALDALGLERLDVVHAGQHTFPLAEGFCALALRRLDPDLEAL